MGPRDTLERFMERGGENFEVRRPGKNSVARGLRNHDKNIGKPYVGFLPAADVQAGDLLIGMVSQDKLRVIDVSSEVDHGEVWQRTAYYESDQAYQHRIASNPISSINIGTMTNSAIQQGSPGAIQNFSVIHDHSDVGKIVTDVLATVESLQLTAEEKSEVVADAQTIQAQLKKVNPGSSVIRGCLEGINGLLEKAAIAAAAAGGSVVAHELIERIRLALGG